jgi:hypothetical protein
MMAQKPRQVTASFTQGDIDVTQQYADLNMGVFMRSSGDFTSAARYFANALEKSPVLDRNVERLCLTNMEAIYRVCGERKIADEIRRFLAPRDVAFCIDASGRFPIFPLLASIM